MGQKKSVGPSVGPGAYYTPERFSSLESKIPFGSGERRRVQAPHLELVQDLMQFRIIPFNNLSSTIQHDQNMPILPQSEPSKDRKESKRKELPKLTSFVGLNNPAKASFASCQKRTLDQIQDKVSQQSQERSYREQKYYQPQKKQIKQNSKNLQKILGLLNIQRGPVAIQSDKVIYMESQQPLEKGQEQDYSSFFLTQQPPVALRDQSKSQLGLANKKSLLSVQPQSSEEKKNLSSLPKAINECDSSKKRMDAKIINWKMTENAQIKGFLGDHFSKKKFMQDVGPGQYNINKKTLALPVNKNNSTSDFQSNSHRLQEMTRLKKQQEEAFHQQQNFINANQHKLLLGAAHNEVSQLENLKQKSKSQIPSNARLFKNGLVKSSIRAEQEYLQEIQRQQRFQHQDRLELVQKQQRELSNVGPGSYDISSEVGKKDDNHGQGLPQDDRFHCYQREMINSRNTPGPGEYQQDAGTNQIFQQIKHQNFPSFGQKATRELKLVNEDQLEGPGPGSYDQSSSL